MIKSNDFLYTPRPFTATSHLMAICLFKIAEAKRSRYARHQVVYNDSADNALSHITARHNVSVTTLPGTVFCWLSTRYSVLTDTVSHTR